MKSNENIYLLKIEEFEKKAKQDRNIKSKEDDKLVKENNRYRELNEQLRNEILMYKSTFPPI